MIPRRFLLMLMALAGGALLAPSASWAQSPTAPVEVLNRGLLEIMRAGTGTPFQSRMQMIAPVAQQAFDLQQILQNSVGPRWSSIPPAQQGELLQVFTRYTAASYVANFDSFSGQRFEILPTLRSVGAQKVVQTRIIPQSGDPARLDYVVSQGGGGWRIVDVLLDGSISRVAVQRSDFRSLFASGGAPALAESLQQKVARLEAGGKE
jgi:phospholipid transport system substrate-binding protein